MEFPRCPWNLVEVLPKATNASNTVNECKIV